MRPSALFFTLCSILLLAACQPDHFAPQEDLTYDIAIPEGFPYPIIPEDNAMTQARVALGRSLFFDPVLSRDSTIACASCHKPALAFADDVPISPGVEGRLGLRNTPSLFNVAWLTRMNKDGGVTKLDLQAIVPIEDEHEMDLSILAAAARLRNSPRYTEMSLKAYGRQPDAFVITRALGAFQRTLTSGRSPYDLGELTPQQARGQALFFSERTQCSTCHSGFNFTTNAFENNGLLADYSHDTGRHRVTGTPSDIGKFRVPSLRNVALTAPYLHNGSIPDLPSLIDRYNSGGMGHPNQSLLIQPLNLTEAEQAELVAFLQALTEVE